MAKRGNDDPKELDEELISLKRKIPRRIRDRSDEYRLTNDEKEGGRQLTLQELDRDDRDDE